MLSRPRILIIVRAGCRSIHRSWTWLTAALADVAISAYDDSDFSADDAHYLRPHVPSFAVPVACTGREMAGW